MGYQRNERVQRFIAGLRTPYTSVGGYPLTCFMTDGGTLCHACAKAHAGQIGRATRDNERDGWAFMGWDVIWEYEGSCPQCEQCCEDLETAYGEVGE